MPLSEDWNTINKIIASISNYTSDTWSLITSANVLSENEKEWNDMNLFQFLLKYSLFDNTLPKVNVSLQQSNKSNKEHETFTFINNSISFKEYISAAIILSSSIKILETKNIASLFHIYNHFYNNFIYISLTTEFNYWLEKKCYNILSDIEGIGVSGAYQDYKTLSEYFSNDLNLKEKRIENINDNDYENETQTNKSGALEIISNILYGEYDRLSIVESSLKNNKEERVSGEFIGEIIREYSFTKTSFFNSLKQNIIEDVVFSDKVLDIMNELIIILEFLEPMIYKVINEYYIDVIGGIIKTALDIDIDRNYEMIRSIKSKILLIPEKFVNLSFQNYNGETLIYYVSQLSKFCNYSNLDNQIFIEIYQKILSLKDKHTSLHSIIDKKGRNVYHYISIFKNTILASLIPLDKSEEILNVSFDIYGSNPLDYLFIETNDINVNDSFKEKEIINKLMILKYYGTINSKYYNQISNTIVSYIEFKDNEKTIKKSNEAIIKEFIELFPYHLKNLESNCVNILMEKIEEQYKVSSLLEKIIEILCKDIYSFTNNEKYFDISLNVESLLLSKIFLKKLINNDLFDCISIINKVNNKIINNSKLINIIIEELICKFQLSEITVGIIQSLNIKLVNSYIEILSDKRDLETETQMITIERFRELLKGNDRRFCIFCKISQLFSFWLFNILKLLKTIRNNKRDYYLF